MGPTPVGLDKPDSVTRFPRSDLVLVLAGNDDPVGKDRFQLFGLADVENLRSG